MFDKSDGTDSDKRMKLYCAELAEYDLTVGIPEGFHSIDMRGHQYINENISKSWSTSGISISEFPAVAIEADNNEAVFLYPMCLLPREHGEKEFTPMSQMVKTGSLIESELRYNRNNPDLDIRPLIRIISGENMSDYAGADTAVVYDLTFRRPFLDQYSHCIGIYLRKYGHTSLLLKIVLSKEGLKNKDKYMRLLLDNIAYGNNPHPDLVKCENVPVTDLEFPTGHDEKNGIINSGL